MRNMMKTSWRFSLSLLVACGGGAATERDVESTTRDEPAAAVSSVEPSTEPSTETEPVAERVTGPTETEPAQEPPPVPVVATNADEAKAALTAAASDIVAFRRLVDGDRGIGVHDAGESTITQYCDIEHLASHAGLGFVMGIDDVFQCDAGLRRCMTRSRDGDGAVFYLRRGNGDALYIDTIVQYARRVPNSDSASVQVFARGSEGVCALYRRVDEEGAAEEVPKLSVFVSSQTGLVPEVLAEHHCGDAAVAAYRERVASAAHAHPTRCDRNPSRCTWSTPDEEITIYGDSGTPTMVAITRPGMVANLARAQQRDLDAFFAASRRHHCDE